jgi:acylaminoacyl-peptidase
VLYTNPRGSTGYGEAFGNIIQRRWPGDDIKDVLAGVDQLLKTGYIDAKRMAVMGGSGGGLMTAWMVGQTDRFRAAVALYPVTNWITHVGSDDNGVLIANVYRHGWPWEDPEDYMRHSPLFYAKNVKTPTMIISGDEDWRVPIAQSAEFYRALKVRGVDTVFVRVPGESHGIGKRPSHRVAVMVHVLAWLDRYITPGDEDR